MLTKLKQYWSDRKSKKKGRALAKLDAHLRQSRGRHLTNACLNVLQWFGVATLVMSAGAVMGLWNGALGSWLALWAITAIPLMGVWTLSAFLPSKTAHNDVLFRVLREHPHIGSMIEVVQGKIERNEVGNFWVRDFFGLANAYLDSLPENTDKEAAENTAHLENDEHNAEPLPTPISWPEPTKVTAQATTDDDDTIVIEDDAVAPQGLDNPYHPALCNFYLSLNSIHTKKAFVTTSDVSPKIFAWRNALKKPRDPSDWILAGILGFLAGGGLYDVLINGNLAGLFITIVFGFVWTVLQGMNEWAHSHLNPNFASQQLRKEVLELIDKALHATPHVRQGGELLIAHIQDDKLASAFLQQVKEHLGEIVAAGGQEQLNVEEMAKKLQAKINPSIARTDALPNTSSHLTP